MVSSDIKDRLFLWFSCIGTLASLIGAITPFYFQNEKIFWPIMFSFAFTTLVCIFLILHYARSYYRTTRELEVKRTEFETTKTKIEKNLEEEKKTGNELLFEIIGKIHDFCHSYRDSNIEIEGLITYQKFPEAKLKILTFFEESCNLVRDLFNELTKKECSVAIKTVIDYERGEVITIARDRVSLKKRGESNIFKIDENMAFREIHKHNKDCFFSNNLKALGTFYHNQNTNWLQSYNCVLVVPIRYYSSNSSLPKLAGYLAVDCKENIDVNKENEEEIFKENQKYILGIFADSLYTFIMKNGKLISK